ncbi:hypothetical protein JD844_016954, partial [Phrynosoma platyrhinos]
WISERRSLKPFTYPVPETRFFHVGVNVYKFKIKYGNTVSINNDLHESVVNEELQTFFLLLLYFNNIPDFFKLYRKVLKNVAYVKNTAKPKVQEDRIYPKQLLQPGEHMEYIRTKNAEDSQREGQEPILQKGAEENIALKKEGFLELLKR